MACSHNYCSFRMVEFLAAECAYSIVLEVLVQLVSPLGADGKMQTPFITTCLAFVLSAGQRACTEAGLTSEDMGSCRALCSRSAHAQQFAISNAPW